MLTEHYIRRFWLGLASIMLILVVLVFTEYRSLRAQTAQLIQLRAQHQLLNQQLTNTLAAQAEKLKQLEVAEKKSAYELN